MYYNDNNKIKKKKIIYLLCTICWLLYILVKYTTNVILGSNQRTKWNKMSQI